MKPNSYMFTAVFTVEEEGGFSIEFPEIENCFTCADTVEEGLLMAKDVLEMTIYDMEEDCKAIPIPQLPNEIPIEKNQFTQSIIADMLTTRRNLDTRSVKKTLTIPYWLNEKGKDEEVNFSAILKEGLLKHLNLEDRR